MDITEQILESFNTLTLNKMRTGLAILGIVIGIGSVIALVSLGQASQQSITNSIQSLGSNLITVSPGSSQSGNVRGSQGSSQTLKYSDVLALEKDTSITTVQSYSPELQRRSQVTAGRNNTNTQIIGAVSAYTEVHKVNIDTGSFISDRNVEAVEKVAVIGPTVVSDLFGDGASPIGQDIRIAGNSFRVIGVTKSKGGTGFGNQDDIIFVPISTAQKILYGVEYLSSLSVEATSDKDITTAEDQLGYALLSIHHITDPTLADFSMFSQNDIINTASSVTGTFTTLLSGIAAISLLVGGIGIMNIMLVTVTERTREIGLRKALGAKRYLIIRQFLIESVILTAVGGVLGIFLGIGISLLISKLMSLPFTLSFYSMLLAIGVSGGIGILFGWYPARTASNLQPIEALRYE